MVTSQKSHKKFGTKLGLLTKSQNHAIFACSFEAELVISRMSRVFTTKKNV